MDFEKYVESNRVSFDNIDDVPREQMWEAIQPRISRRKTKIRSITRLLIAASLIGLFSAPFLIRFGGGNGLDDSFIASDPEFIEKEQYYFQLATDKKESLNYSELDPETYGDIMQELNSIDSMYADLKQELAQIPDANRAIETAIKYHERRLRILELLEREIQNQNRSTDNESPVKI